MILVSYPIADELANGAGQLRRKPNHKKYLLLL